MARFIALLDASVLYSIRATNLALQVASAGIFQPRWSSMIEHEWSMHVRDNNPNADPRAITRRLQQMNAAFPDALVEGYLPLMAGLALPDPNDVHVLAAAIAARADVIVTFNLRDFPDASLAPHGLEAQHPDTFLLHQLTLAPGPFVAAAAAVRGRLRRPPFTVAEFLEGLRKAQLPLVADALVPFAQSL